MKKLLIAIVMAGLAGCSSIDLIDDQHVEFRDNRLIIIKYNSIFETFEDAFAYAQKHCEQYKRKAEPIIPAIDIKALHEKHGFYCVAEDDLEYEL